MNDPSQATAQMRALLEAASPGPWRLDLYPKVGRIVDSRNLTVCPVPPEADNGGMSYPDARLAVLAPGLALACDMAEAAEALLAVVEESFGIAGWPLNNVDGRWGEFEFVDDFYRALAAWTKLLEEVPDA